MTHGTGEPCPIVYWHPIAGHGWLCVSMILGTIYTKFYPYPGRIR